MTEITLDKLFEDQYKIRFTETQKERLRNFFKSSNITPENNTITIKNTLNSLLLDASPSKEIMINKLNSIITIEDVVYTLYPVIFSDDIYINIANVKNYKYTKKIKNATNPEMEQNIIILRSITFNSTDVDPDFKEHYYIFIYNKDIELVSDGIMFV